MAAEGSSPRQHREGPEGPWGDRAQGGPVQSPVQGSFQDCAGQGGQRVSQHCSGE